MTPECGVPDASNATDDELDDEHPLALVNGQICDMLIGFGSSEDNEDVIRFFASTGLPMGTVKRIHRAICSAEVNRAKP